MGYEEDGGHFMWCCTETGVQKLVNKQVVLFQAPVKQCKTADHVSVVIDSLIVFKITDGRKFLYGIGPEKLDLFLRSSLEESMRSLASAVTIDKLYGIQGEDTDYLREYLNKQLNPVGVDILSFT